MTWHMLPGTYLYHMLLGSGILGVRPGFWEPFILFRRGFGEERGKPSTYLKVGTLSEFVTYKRFK